ncbi:hypothetical protein Mgra_00000167 [Meloidogyne graminicola]|uniref:Uncharacterized protein n=1 Tax=Meloidogyne graminicola TaxID=189291 RepID=A0A8T0A4W4_9BILA|nr:hypothetical protein Mgra_00000167 [Meloidogyne graminicola]
MCNSRRFLQSNRRKRRSKPHIFFPSFLHKRKLIFKYKMFGLIASTVECSYLTIATFSALFSIIYPKIKGSIVLLSVPILVTLAPTTLATNKIIDDGEGDGLNNYESILN